MDPSIPLVAIDDVEMIDAAAQESLFHAINLRRADPAATMIVAGNAAPRDLALDAAREDLRSRLAWGLVYRLERLDDGEKDAALARHADEQGFPLSADVRRYLLTHWARDLGALMRLVDALDRHARERQRILTVPLIREFMQRDLPLQVSATA
jgi:DnaA family protein